MAFFYLLQKILDLVGMVIIKEVYVNWEPMVMLLDTKTWKDINLKNRG